MRANKAKTSKKAVKKVSRRAVKKELETSISDKFLEALKGLGHDAEKLTKEIKKTSKVLAKKLSDKYHEVKVAVEEKLESKKPKAEKTKKPLTSAKRAVSSAVIKAEKVVAKAASAAAQAKAPVKKISEDPASNSIKTSAAKPAAKRGPSNVVGSKPRVKSTVAVSPAPAKVVRARKPASISSLTAPKPAAADSKLKAPAKNGTAKAPKTNL